MKTLHLDEQIKLDQEDPHWEEFRKHDALFNTFMEKCKKQISNKDVKTLEPLLEKYTNETWKIRKSFNEFHSNFLRDIPFVVVLAHWIKGVVSDRLWREQYVRGMGELLDKKLIPLVDVYGNNLTLETFRLKGHQDIIENIRCEKGWTLFEKEELVQCYIQFSYNLARYTFNYVPPGYDPDRRRCASRAIKYEFFFDFVQHLSERDGLIAKVLYFGAPSIEEMLTLNTAAIDRENFALRFPSKTVSYPKHLIYDLLTHVNQKSEKYDIVFTNLRGAEVERAHLNQSFARACEKMPKNIKITPGSLLKLKDESNEDIFLGEIS